MTKRDYYEILGVARDADEQTVKTAYRKMALKYHPDRNPGDKGAEEKFKEAAEAYSVISDPQKRGAYDRFGHQGLTGAAAPGFDPVIFEDFSDILGDFFGFGDLFGGGSARRRNRPQRGEDVRYDLEIGFEDIIQGLSAEIQVPRIETCSGCNGTGADQKDGLSHCPICRGRGEVVFQQGFLSIRRTCTQCAGRGQIVRRACKSCRGEGYQRADRKLKVSVPPGVDTGTRLRLQQEGQPGVNGGPPGDLYVVIKVKNHAIFDRRDNDLLCSVPVNIAQAALGTEVDILTFDGLERVKIPEGTQHGGSIRLRGRGIPHLNGNGRGDLIIIADVKIPTRLTREQKKMFEQLRDILPTENEPQERGLLDKVKDYFL